MRGETTEERGKASEGASDSGRDDCASTSKSAFDSSASTRRQLTLEASGHGVESGLGAQQVVVNVGEAGIGQVIPAVESRWTSGQSLRLLRLDELIDSRASVTVEHRWRLDRLPAAFAALALEQIVRLTSRLLVLEELTEVVARIVTLDVLLGIDDAGRQVLLVRLTLEDCGYAQGQQQKVE